MLHHGPEDLSAPAVPRPARSGTRPRQPPPPAETAPSVNPCVSVQFINRLSDGVPLGQREGEAPAFPEDTKALQRHLCVCQLSRALGLHHALDPDGKLRLIAELKAHYRHGLKFGSSLSFTRNWTLLLSFIDIQGFFFKQGRTL